jgi:hypothetical protein
MVSFQSVEVSVNGSGTYSGLAVFRGQITSADVCLRGLNLTHYTETSLFHYRGPTIVQINSVVVGNDDVQFTFKFDFSQDIHYQMVGSINFLVIAETE